MGEELQARHRNGPGVLLDPVSGRTLLKLFLGELEKYFSRSCSLSLLFPTAGRKPDALTMQIPKQPEVPVSCVSSDAWRLLGEPGNNLSNMEIMFSVSLLCWFFFRFPNLGHSIAPLCVGLPGWQQGGRKLEML